MTATYTGMNPNGTGTLSDTDQLWNSVKDILTTPLASRVMRRDYGSLVPDLIDEPQNDATRLQCMSAAVIALARWETGASGGAIAAEVRASFDSCHSPRTARARGRFLKTISPGPIRFFVS